MINKILKLYRRKMWSQERYARYIGVKIGKESNIQDVNFGSEPYLIEIGNHVQITNGTKFFTHGAAWVLREKYPDIDFFGKIKIGNNVYIGNNSLILSGVSVGSNVIIAAGSVVTKSIKDGRIVGGNPAVIIGRVDDFDTKVIGFNVNSKGFSYRKKKKFLLSLDDDRFIKK